MRQPLPEEQRVVAEENYPLFLWYLKRTRKKLRWRRVHGRQARWVDMTELADRLLDAYLIAVRTYYPEKGKPSPFLVQALDWECSRPGRKKVVSIIYLDPGDLNKRVRLEPRA